MSRAVKWMAKVPWAISGGALGLVVTGVPIAVALITGCLGMGFDGGVFMICLLGVAAGSICGALGEASVSAGKRRGSLLRLLLGLMIGGLVFTLAVEAALILELFREDAYYKAHPDPPPLPCSGPGMLIVFGVPFFFGTGGWMGIVAASVTARKRLLEVTPEADEANPVAGDAT